MRGIRVAHEAIQRFRQESLEGADGEQTVSPVQQRNLREEEAFDWLKFAGDHDFAHAMLYIFSSESGSRQSFVDVDHCMELMEKQFVGKSEITYWELLKHPVVEKARKS
ncbi:uncharacterized protein A4U43_C05F22580 [Asparagus officinalis]|uniref:Uncharacterized protein n=1 Tax=Asparagus officinalis TaxID=4686 RepID=A0A5P1EY32_ASPOF|nr:uncharacterized protein A4U43_C05F22580 [Asparagus officinalis]